MKRLLLFAGILIIFVGCQKEEELFSPIKGVNSRNVRGVASASNRKANLSGTKVDHEMERLKVFDNVYRYLSRGVSGGRVTPLIDNSPCYNPYDGITEAELQQGIAEYNANTTGEQIAYEDIELPILKESLPVYTGNELLLMCDQLLQQAGSEEDSIVILKQFYYTNIAIHGSMADSLGYIEECWTYTWDDLTYALQTGNGNTVCGGHSDGLILLLNHYGWRAYNMGYGNGIPGDAGGDAATVVWSRDASELWLVTAMFNSGYVDENKRLIGLKEAYARLRDGDRESVGWLGNNQNARYLVLNHPVISKPGGQGPTYQWSGRTCDIHCTDTPGRYIMKAPRTAEGYVSSIYHEDEFPEVWDWWEGYIQAAGYPSSYSFDGAEDLDLFPLMIRGVYAGNQATWNWLSPEAVEDSIVTWRGYDFMQP
jgi:hypothetical protein